MNKKTAKYGLALAVNIVTHEAMALESIDAGGAKFQPGLEVGTGYIYNKNQSYGSDVSFFGLPIDRTSSRLEGYAKPSLQFEMSSESMGTFFGKASTVSSFTRGGTDGSGFTRDDPTDTDWDDGFVGWRSEGVFSSDFPNKLSLSVGRQPFSVGTGFFLAEGHIDQGHEGASWLGPRRAFDWSALAQVDLGKFHIDAFQLKSRTDIDVVGLKETLELNGVNLEWKDDSLGRYGIAAYKATDTAVEYRDGLRAFSAFGSFSPIKDTLISSEYAWQKAKDNGSHADAWYLEGTYTFSSVSWAPAITYRYAEFEPRYDSMLYGYAGDWGYWFQGEIVGNNMLFNMNQRVNMLKLTVSPSETVRAGVIGYKFDFYRAPEGVDDRRFANEVNFYLDWFPSVHWMLGGVIGYSKPEEGAKQYFGKDKDSLLIETYAIYKF